MMNMTAIPSEIQNLAHSRTPPIWARATPAIIRRKPTPAIPTSLNRDWSISIPPLPINSEVSINKATSQNQPQSYLTISRWIVETGRAGLNATLPVLAIVGEGFALEDVHNEYQCYSGKDYLHNQGKPLIQLFLSLFERRVFLGHVMPHLTPSAWIGRLKQQSLMAIVSSFH